MPAYSYTAWEDYSYDLDLGEIADAQSSGAAPDDSICKLRTVQLQATSFVGPMYWDQYVPYLAKEQTDQGPGASGLGYGGDGNAATITMIHAAYGDGISIAPWYDLELQWVASVFYGVSIGQHAAYPSGGSVVGEPFIELDFPTRTMTSGVTQDIAITWTLSGGDPAYGGLDDLQPFGLPTYYRWRLRITLERSLDDGTGAGSGPSPVMCAYPEDLGVTFTGMDGPAHLYSVAVQWEYSAFLLDPTGIGYPKDGVGLAQTVPIYPVDPGLDAPALTTPGLRGYTAPSTWGDGTHHEGTAVIAGNSTATVTETLMAPLLGGGGIWIEFSPWYRVDSYEQNSYQGYWTIEAGTDPVANYAALLHHPADTDSGIQSLYGVGATYEYDWDGLSDVAAAIFSTQVTDDTEYFTNPTELRPATFAAPDDLKVWLTPDDLAAIDTTDLVEGTAGSGVALHVTTTHAREGAWFYGAPSAASERGGRYYVLLAGTVTIAGRRRVKYLGIVPPFQQNQRLSLVSGHGTQATASPPRLRAQGDL